MTIKRTKSTNKRASELSSKFVAEEIRTGKYPRKQAVAVGLSRARTTLMKENHKRQLDAILTRY